MTPIAAPAPVPSSTLTRVAVGVSIAVHVGAVLLSLGYAGAGLFEPSEAEAVSVSLVTPEEVPSPEPEKAAEQKPELDLSKLDLRLSPTENPAQQQQQQKAQPQASATKPQAAAKAEQPAKQQQAAASAQSSQAASSQAPPPQQQSAAQPAYTAPQPDISMKYQVDLGLKMLPPPPPSQIASAQDGKSDFDAPAMSKADVDGNSIAAFRAKLKQCAVLPAQIGSDDKVVIVLRAQFNPDGRLAVEPTLIEASASPAKGLALMQAAVGALQSCQPHVNLPADKYSEWRVMDLRFTPQDFRKG